MDLRNKEQASLLLTEEQDWQNIKKYIFDSRCKDTHLTMVTKFHEQDGDIASCERMELFFGHHSNSLFDRIMRPIFDKHFAMIVEEINQHITDIDKQLQYL